jgi:hypothetical protein
MCQYAFTDAPGYQLNQVGRMDPGLFHKLMDEVPGKPVVSFTGGRRSCTRSSPILWHTPNDRDGFAR